MLKIFNFKWDKRTLLNILRLPFIICINIPVVLIIWGIEWLNDWSDIVYDKLPKWNR